MTLEELLDAAHARIRRYSPEEARAATQHDAAIVDIRGTHTREREGVVPGAFHIPRTVLEWRLASEKWRNEALDDRRVILICDHGYSSALAAAALVDLGRDAGDVVGGFEAWRDAGLPVTGARSFDGLPGTAPPD